MSLVDLIVLKKFLKVGLSRKIRLIDRNRDIMWSDPVENDTGYQEKEYD